MGWKLDLSGLSDGEAEHVLQVVQRDMRLRKKEEKRLSEMRQELDEEGSRCSLLSRQHRFNERCCIRCCSPFTFLLNPKRQCLDCQYNVCKTCCAYVKQDRAWLCSACQKSRLLKTQSLEWYYNNVKCRFKRFGSAKVLKTLYRKHLARHGTLAELTEGSTYEESIGNEGSICGSDSAFYRQSEEHSMADTLTVALRVAEEAIDEAITKAERHTDSQEKRNEAYYLTEHREELIEELATTIVQKIIRRRRNLGEMKPEYDLDWPPEQRREQPPAASSSPVSQQPCSSSTLASQASLQASLWRSRSAFSLLDNDPPELKSGISKGPDLPQGLKKEGGGSDLASWKSVDRLDNSSASSVLKSTDGNWMALQSAQLSRPSLLTKRKSLVFSELEKESGVVSAYDRLGSDTEAEAEDAWGAALREIRRKFNSDQNIPDQTQSSYSRRPTLVSPTPDRGASSGTLNSDSDGGPGSKSQKPLPSHLKRKVPVEHRRPPGPRRIGIMDVNFNPEGAESSGAEDLEEGRVRRSHKRRRSKKEPPGGQGKTVPPSSCVLAYSSRLLDELVNKQSRSFHFLEAVSPDTLTSDALTSGVATPEPLGPEVEEPSCGTPGWPGLVDSMDQELSSKLRVSVNQLSFTDDEINRMRGNDRERDGRSKGERDEDQEEEERSWGMDIDMEGGKVEEEDNEEMTGDRDGDELKSALLKLVSQVSGMGFLSTDDELDLVGRSEKEWKEMDRVGLSDREMEGEREEREREVERNKEGLNSKLCRLANQVNAAEFSSTEDELDREGRGEGEEEEEEGGEEREGVREEIEEETLWEMEADKEERNSKLRDLASLVSASQFSSTDDELDEVGEEEEEERTGGKEGDGLLGTLLDGGRRGEMVTWVMGIKTEEEGTVKEEERKDSIGDLDVRLFDLEDKGRETDTKVETVVDGDISEYKVRAEMVKCVTGERGGEMETEGLGDREVETSEKVDGEEIEAEKQTQRDAGTESEKRTEREGDVEEEGLWEEKCQREEKSPGEAVVMVEGERRGEIAEGREERERTDSVEGEVEFDRIISSLVMAMEEMQDALVEDSEMERHGETEGGREERDEDGNEFARSKPEFWQGEEEEDINCCDYTIKMNEIEEMREWLSERGERPVRNIAENTVELDRERITWTKSGECVMERDGELVGEKEVGGYKLREMRQESETETDLGDQTLLLNPDQTVERPLDVTTNEMPQDIDKTEDKTEREERGGYEGGEVEEERQEEKQDETKQEMKQETDEEKVRKKEGSEEEKEEKEEEVEGSAGENSGKEEKETENNSLAEPQESAPSVQEAILSPEEIQNDRPVDVEFENTLHFFSTMLQQRYSAVSLRSITTEVLKVLNATEDLLQGEEGYDYSRSQPKPPSLTPNTDTKKLDEQLSRLEENVYVAAGTVFGLEAELGDLEACARGISGATSDQELSFLEHQMASAAAQVQQSEMQVTDIAARIAALKNAGLNVVPRTRKTQTLDSSRQRRRRLPAPPLKDKET